MAISARASLFPTVSIMCAAFKVSRRACSISMRESAIHSIITPCSASGLPNASRLLTRSHISSTPRPETPLRYPEALALVPDHVRGGDARVGERDLRVAVRGVVVAED